MIDIDDLRAHTSQATGATAISYAWGAADRQIFVLGHEVDNAQKLVTFELGSEWNIEKFQLRLVEIGQAGYIWIDRLCVPQKDDELREMLLNIPSIYSKLSVVLLYPRSPCLCLSSAWESWAFTCLAGRDTAEARARLQAAVEGTHCSRANGANIWGTRMWPDQEFRCARRIHCVWAESEPNQCKPIILPNRAIVSRYSIELPPKHGPGLDPGNIFLSTTLATRISTGISTTV